MKYGISCILTAFNEEDHIEAAFLTCKEAMMLSGKIAEAEFFLVDDGSVDATRERMNKIASKEDNVTVVTSDANRGQGYSLKSCIPLCNFDYVHIGFGFIPHESNEYARLYSQIGSADIITSWGREQHQAPVRKFLSNLYVTILNFSFNNQLRYYNGSAIYPLAALKNITIRSESMGAFAEVLIKLLDRNLSYCEIGLGYSGFRDRQRGSANLNMMTVIKVAMLFIDLMIAVRLPTFLGLAKGYSRRS